MSYLTHRPARGNMNQGFGPRPKPTPSSPATHYGQDYGWGGGDAIIAARGGIVTAYGPAGAYGNRLVIQHGRTWFGSSVETWYCHLAAARVAVGDEVDAGADIAWMGATGNVTAKHLHFELRADGVAVDPEPYFAAGSDTAAGDHTPVEMEEEELSAIRDELVTILHEIKAQNNVAAVLLGRLVNRQSMPVYELVKTADDPQVWFAVDRVERVPVKDARTLADYQYFMRQLGQDAAVDVVTNLDAFGAAHDASGEHP